MVIRHRLIKLIILALMAFAIMPAAGSFAGTITYEYDELNRLKIEKYQDGTEIEYSYDRLGNRTSRTVTVPFYIITASAGDGGSIAPSDEVSVRKWSSQAFQIIPDDASGYKIADVLVDNASQGPVSSYTFENVTTTHSIHASFELKSYNLNVSVNTTGSGSGGTVSGSGINCPGICSGQYVHGTSVTLTASPSAGYRFTGWSGDCSGSGTCTVAIYGNKSVTANFIQTFTITSYAGDNGSLSPSGKSTVDYGGSLAYTLTAVPGALIADMLIDGVSTGSTASTYQFTNVVADHTIAGVFSCNTLQQFPVMIARTPVKYYSSLNEAYNDAVADETLQARTVYMSGSIIFNKNISLAGGYSCDFAAQTGIPTPLQGGVSIQQGVVTMKNFALQAQLPEGAYQVNISIGGDTPGGYITSSLNDMKCGTNCTGVYYKGTNITLTAEPKACYDFVGWSGCTNIGGTNGDQCTVSVDAAKNVTANFRIKTFKITSYAGSNGSITPSTIVNCSSSATFTISPDSAAIIADVIIDGVSTGLTANNYQFGNVTAPHSITAVFACNTQRLPVRIASAPDVLYPSVQDAYDHASANDIIQARDVYLSGALDLTTSGKNITLEGGYNCDYTVQTGRATPFKGGVNVSGGTVNMKNFELLAQLPENQYLMDVELTGDSSGGSVTSSLNDMNCGPTGCANAYYSGTMVTLTATPKECHDFTGWTGCTSVNGNQCTVTIDQAKNVTANFTIRKYLIIVDAGHSGIITPVTGYVNCGSDPTYTVTADSGALIGTNNVEVDGTPVGPASSSTAFTYTFDDVQSAHTISATYLCPSPLVRIEGSGDYGSIQEAYNAAPDGAVIKTQDYILDYRGVPLTLNNDHVENGIINKTVTIKGGYYCDFTTNEGRTTHIKGSINIGAGKVAMENIVLEQ